MAPGGSLRRTRQATASELAGGPSAKPAASPAQSDRHSEERREDVTENRGGRFRSESVSVLDRHDLPPLVSQLDIADRLGVTRHAVKQWRRRHGDFPLPALYIDLGEK